MSFKRVRLKCGTFFGCRVTREAELSVLTSRSLNWRHHHRLSRFLPLLLHSRKGRQESCTKLNRALTNPYKLIFRIQNSIFFYYLVIKRDLSEEKLRNRHWSTYSQNENRDHQVIGVA